MPERQSTLTSQLGQLAALISLGRHVDAVDRAIPLACDLLTADVDAPGVLATALLAPGTTWRDGREAIVEMLRELGGPDPEPKDSREQWSLLLRAFGWWDLPVEVFFGPFITQVPGIEDQSDLDGELLVLFEEFDHQSLPQPREAIVERMRAAVRRWHPSATDTPIG